MARGRAGVPQAIDQSVPLDLQAYVPPDDAVPVDQTEVLDEFDPLRSAGPFGPIQEPLSRDPVPPRGTIPVFPPPTPVSVTPAPPVDTPLGLPQMVAPAGPVDIPLNRTPRKDGSGGPPIARRVSKPVSRYGANVYNFGAGITVRQGSPDTPVRTTTQPDKRTPAGRLISQVKTLAHGARNFVPGQMQRTPVGASPAQKPALPYGEYPPTSGSAPQPPPKVITPASRPLGARTTGKDAYDLDRLGDDAYPAGKGPSSRVARQLSFPATPAGVVAAEPPDSSGTAPP